MRVIGLNCSNCGAVLQVARKAEFVTCGFCDARLRIERTENTFYAQTLEAIDERTQELAKDVAKLKRTAALDRLDRIWEKRRKQYMIKGKDGHYSVPSKGMAIFSAILAVIIGIVFMGVGHDSKFSLIGIVVVIGAIVMGFVLHGKAQDYESAYAEYRRKRRELIRGEGGGA